MLSDVAATIITHHEGPYLEAVLTQLYLNKVAKIVLVENKTPMVNVITNKPLWDTKDTITKFLTKYSDAKDIMTYRETNWDIADPVQKENIVRDESLRIAREEYDMKWAWIVDADEVYSNSDIAGLWTWFKSQSVPAAKIKWYTYWRSIHWRIDPPEPFMPTVIVPTTSKCLSIRFFDVTPIAAVCPPEKCMARHYSYARKPFEVKRKVTLCTHACDIKKNWFEEVFMKWSPDMQNLHPTDPHCYTKAIKCTLPLPESMVGHEYAGVDVLRDKTRLVVSFTTIPSRIDKIRPMIGSVLSQSMCPDRIVLWLPTLCNKENTGYVVPQWLKELPIEIKTIGRDIGPATKLVPTLLDEEDSDTRIVTLDDDVIYGTNTIEELFVASSGDQNAVFGLMGCTGFDTSTQHYHTEKIASNIEVGVLGGYRGVIYRRGLFDDSIFDDLESLLEEDMFLCDDQLFSWNLARRGVKRIVTKSKSDCGFKFMGLGNGIYDQGQVADQSIIRLEKFYTSNGWKYPKMSELDDISRIIQEHTDDLFADRLRICPEVLKMGFWENHFEHRSLSRYPCIKGNILDFGCGSGHSDVWLARRGYVVHGCDVNKTGIMIANYLASKESLDVSNRLKFNTVEEMSGLKFDSVWSSNVFEHIIDTRLAVEQIKKFVKAGSYILISVPQGYHYDVPDHVHHFHDLDELHKHFCNLLDVVLMEHDKENHVLRFLSTV